MKFLIDTNDGFKEQVNEEEVIKWGSSFGVGIEMELSEAIKALENNGYDVVRLD